MRFLLLVVGVGVIGLAGFLGYVVYPRFGLPPVEGAAVLILAAGAGIASFFSPCSFPLLLAILGRRSEIDTGRTGRRGEFTYGAALALGAGAFLLLTGIVVAAGGGLLIERVTFASPTGILIRAAVGVVLIVLGLIQIGLIGSPFHALERVTTPLMERQARLRRDRPLAGHALFGFVYIAAGFG